MIWISSYTAILENVVFSVFAENFGIPHSRFLKPYSNQLSKSIPSEFECCLAGNLPTAYNAESSLFIQRETIIAMRLR